MPSQVEIDGLYDEPIVPTLAVAPARKKMGKSCRNLQKMREVDEKKFRRVLEKRANRSISLPMCGTHIDPETGESNVCLMAPLG